MKGLKKILAPQNLTTVTSGGVVAVAGIQTATMLNAFQGSSGTPNPYILTSDDVGNMMAVLAATEPSPAVQNSANNATGQTRRLQIEKITSRYALKNNTNVPISVWLYDVTFRRDSSVGTGAPRGDVVWNTGLTDEGTVIPGQTIPPTNQASLPGSTPFQSQDFCQVFKVKKVTKFTLAAGTTHMHTINIRPGNPINFEYAKRYAAFKGLTTGCMIVIQGTPSHSAATGAQTLSQASIDYVTETRYMFTALERARTAYTAYSYIASPTDARTILEDTDLASAVAFA